MEKQIQRMAGMISKDRNVKGIYLFGSQVSGKTREGSDIDMCIITKDEQEDIEYPIFPGLEISFFHLLPLSLKYRIFNEGIPLVVKDVRLINELKIKTLRDYLEIKPLINRFL